jgi:hypothetical protein
MRCYPKINRYFPVSYSQSASPNDEFFPNSTRLHITPAITNRGFTHFQTISSQRAKRHPAESVGFAAFGVLKDQLAQEYFGSE